MDVFIFTENVKFWFFESPCPVSEEKYTGPEADKVQMT